MARLYEHQAKALLRRSGVMVPRGVLCRTPAGAATAAIEIGLPVVVKAQVLSGGRGKAGGVRFAATASEAFEAAGALLGETLKGLAVREVLVEERVGEARETYLAVTTNQGSGKPSVLVALAGGMDVEDTSAENPQGVIRHDVDILRGLTGYDALNVVRRAGAVGRERILLASLLEKMYRIYRQHDCKLLEINPAGIVGDGVIALDARMEVDDDALFRQGEIPIAPGDETGDRPPTLLERAAGSIDQNDHRGTVHFVQIDPDGSVASARACVPVGFDCVGTGASLTTMDELVPLGYFPVNFCDTSGNPPGSKLYRATRIIFAQPHIKGYLFVSCVSGQQLDNTARGIIKALLDIYPESGGKPDIPCVFVFRGTWDEEAMALFERHGLTSSPLVRVLGRDCTEKEAARHFDGLYKEWADGKGGRVRA